MHMGDDDSELNPESLTNNLNRRKGREKNNMLVLGKGRKLSPISIEQH